MAMSLVNVFGVVGLLGLVLAMATVMTLAAQVTWLNAQPATAKSDDERWPAHSPHNL